MADSGWSIGYPMATTGEAIFKSDERPMGKNGVWPAWMFSSVTPLRGSAIRHVAGYFLPANSTSRFHERPATE